MVVNTPFPLRLRLQCAQEEGCLGVASVGEAVTLPP
jgi:hypothetical protein